jgi:LPS sulfotransferase NodH
MHHHPVNDLYNARFDYPRWGGPPRSTLMLATIPRTGSTYFAIELWRTGVLGAPMEYVNFINRLHDMVPRLGKGEVTEYWRELQARRTSPNGVFSFKAFSSDFAHFGTKYPDLLPHVSWDRVVYLTRRDKIGQALSYARAFQTKQWFANQEPHHAPEYDKLAVDQAVQWVHQSEAAWELLLERKGCDVLRVHYEDLLSDVDHVVQKVATFMEIELSSFQHMDLPLTNVQRDATSGEWRRRYLEDAKSLAP